MNNNFQDPNRGFYGAYPTPPKPWYRYSEVKPPKGYNPYTDDQSVFKEVYEASPERFAGPSPLPYETPQMHQSRICAEKSYVASRAYAKLKTTTGYTALTLLLFLIIREGLGMILSAVQTSVNESTYTILTLIFTSLQYIVIAAIVIYAMTIGKKNKFYTYMHKPQVGIWFILKWSLIGFGLSHLAAIVSDMVFSVLEQMGLHINDLFVPLPHGIAESILYFIAFVICAPIFEELIFRGILLTPLMKFGNSFAVIITSVLFGLYHMNHSQLIFPMIFGLVLAYMDIRSRSVFPSMIAHAIFNGYSYFLGLIASFTNYEELLENPELELAGNDSAVALFGAMTVLLYVLIAFSVVLLIIEIITNKKQFSLPVGDCSLTVSEKICAFISSPLMVLYFIVIALYIVLVSFVDVNAITESITDIAAILMR